MKATGTQDFACKRDWGAEVVDASTVWRNDQNFYAFPPHLTDSKTHTRFYEKKRDFMRKSNGHLAQP